MQTPNNFRGPHSLPIYHPAPTPAVVSVEPAVRYEARAKQTHHTGALVTLRMPNKVFSNREALRVTGLSPGAPVDLISPRRNGGTDWLLDTRPTASSRLREYRGRYFFSTPAAPDSRIPIGGRLHPSRAAFDVGPELTERVCVSLPDGKQVCQVRGTGLYPLTPRRA